MYKNVRCFLTSWAALAVACLTFPSVAAAPSDTGEPLSGNYRNNRQPLLQKEYIELPLGSIRAEGWMQEPDAYFTQQGKDYGEEETIELIPYGCTTLRITEFPVR